MLTFVVWSSLPDIISRDDRREDRRDERDEVAPEGGSLISANGWNVELVGSRPHGSALAVYTVGGYSYLCAGGALVILNVSNPANPLEIGSTNIPGLPYAIYVSGGYAYVVGEYESLWVVDISNPTTPNVVGQCDDLDWPVDVHVVGNYAYVADEDEGLWVIDISNPATPNVVGQCDDLDWAVGVHVVGNYAYVADEDEGLWVIDISNPTTPNVVGLCDTLDEPLDVHVVGSYAYVADEDEGLWVIDISNPTTPNVVGLCDTLDEPLDVHVVGSYAYVLDEDEGLWVIDVSNPIIPNVVGQVGQYDEFGWPLDVHVAGSYAYVADEDQGLHVIDVSNPATPNVVGFYGTPGYPYEVYVYGNYAYVADSYGLRVMDVSDPSEPTDIGFYDTPGRARDVCVVGDYAYVASWGLHVIDVSDPSNPDQVGFCDTPVSPTGIDVHGGYAYVADGYEVLRVIDISDPTDPYEVAYYDIPYWPVDVHVVGDYAYMVGYETLWVIDISDLSNIQEVGSCAIVDDANEVHVVGDYAYLASDDAFWMIDISDPSSPHIAGLYPDRVYGVHLSGGYAYVGGSLQVIDISEPSSLTSVGYYDIPGRARGIHVADGLAYLTSSYGGLYILQYTGPDYAVPAPITDLSAAPSDTVDGEIELEWTAPGDDWDVGTASDYIVKYNSVPIMGSNWDESHDVDAEPTPGPSGSAESMTVTVPYPGVVYYFAIRTQDEMSNTSKVSNSPSAADGAIVQLYAGWNLVCVMCTTTISIDDFLASLPQCDAVWMYDASVPEWLRHVVSGPDILNNLTQIGPGYGLWIWVTEDCTWDCSESVSLSPSSLTMRRPPFLLYGKVKSESVPDNRAGYSESILLRSGDREAASYVMGSNLRYGDYYVLEIPVDDTFSQGDAAQIYVNDILAEGYPIEFGGMGVIRRHDISYMLPPRITRLLQNYPNPFNPETWIPYQLEEESQVEIRIYKATGQLVRTLNLGLKPAGFYTDKAKAAYWDGRNTTGEPVASGIYFYSIQAGEYAATKKMIVTR